MRLSRYDWKVIRVQPLESFPALILFAPGRNYVILSRIFYVLKDLCFGVAQDLWNITCA